MRQKERMSPTVECCTNRCFVSRALREKSLFKTKRSALCPQKEKGKKITDADTKDKCRLCAADVSADEFSLGVLCEILFGKRVYSLSPSNNATESRQLCRWRVLQIKPALAALHK